MDQQAAALGRLQAATSEITMSGATDSKKLAAVIAATDAAEVAADAAREDAEKALKAVPVKREDVAFLFRQFDLAVPVADRLLKQHGGDLEAVIKALLKL